MRTKGLEALAAGDWYGSYECTKSWIWQGGGAWVVDAWLQYVASALLHGQPRSAIHSVDMALEAWIEHPADRSILYYTRAVVIHRCLSDPKTAIADYIHAARDSPAWLQDQVAADLDACRADAERSRKRKPSVGPAPLNPPAHIRTFVAPPQDDRPASGTRPPDWDMVLKQIAARTT